MNILIACEESQRVCNEFRSWGHNAFSCDIEQCSGGHPEWHIQRDVIPILDGYCRFITEDNKEHSIEENWDLIIAHPPCTYLTVTGNKWFNTDKYGEKAVLRKIERGKAIDFFLIFTRANCKHIAIENPIGIMSSKYRKPDQIIQPYQFGEPVRKATCLWLKNLPPLNHTCIVEPEIIRFDSGRTMSKWYYETSLLPLKNRSKIRSKTFPGIAKAMVEQWSEYLMEETHE